MIDVTKSGAWHSIGPCTAGDDETIPLLVEEEISDHSIDITGGTVYVDITRDPAEDQTVISKDITDFPRGNDGVVEVQLTSEETSGLEGSYFYNIKLDLDNELNTLLYGVIYFDESVGDH